MIFRKNRLKNKLFAILHFNLRKIFANHPAPLFYEDTFVGRWRRLRWAVKTPSTAHEDTFIWNDVGNWISMLQRLSFANNRFWLVKPIFRLVSKLYRNACFYIFLTQSIGINHIISALHFTLFYSISDYKTGTDLRLFVIKS